MHDKDKAGIRNLKTSHRGVSFSKEATCLILTKKSEQKGKLDSKVQLSLIFESQERVLPRPLLWGFRWFLCQMEVFQGARDGAGARVYAQVAQMSARGQDVQRHSSPPERISTSGRQV